MALLLVLATIWYPSSLWPTPVLVVAAGGVLTWLNTKRFRELAAAYSLTAHEIGIAKSGLTAIVEEVRFSEFVGDMENAFSREHTQWVARRDVGR